MSRRLSDIHEKTGAAGGRYWRHLFYDLQVERLIEDNNRILGVKCGERILTADHYIVAFGAYSTRLLAGLVSQPFYPKGYSLTIPITDEAKAPASNIPDETYKVAVTRFDDLNPGTGDL